MCPLCLQDKPSYGAYKRCKDCHKAIVGENYKRNREQRIERMKAYNLENRVTYLAAQKAYYERNKSKWRKKKDSRLAQMIGAYTEQEWMDLCRQYDYKCLACGEQTILTADHVHPVSLGGRNTIDNIQPLCRSCNSRKGITTTDYR